MLLLPESAASSMLIMQVINLKIYPLDRLEMADGRNSKCSRPPPATSSHERS